jgi:hypothetical protein
MRTNHAVRQYFLALLGCALLSLPLQSQSAAVPVPPALANAKTVFLSNQSADTGLFPDIYSGGPDRGFNEFYAALKASGRFELVSDPARADLVLALRLVAPMDPASARDKPRPEGFPVSLPLFRLEIYDRPTHYVLWTLTEPIEKALLQRNNDRNFGHAIARLAADLQRLSAPAPAP